MSESEVPVDFRQVENKLSAARTKLILDKPFLGALVLRLPMVSADKAWCPTTATDARKFYYNAEFIQELDAQETQFILAHEALHCALLHFARRQHRIKHRWDLACDYAINPLLLEEGLKPPPGMIMLNEYKGMIAEEIYPCLDDNDMTETLDQHLYDKEDQQQDGSSNSAENPLDEQKQSPPEEKPQEQESEGSGHDNNDGSSESGQQEQDQKGAGESPQQEFDESAGGADSPPPPLSQQEADELSVQWQQRLAGAAQQAALAGKMSAIMQRRVDNLLQPRLPWRSLLARYMSTTARDDYSYTRPSSRRGDPAIFPTLKSSQINIVIALDVSGSVSDKEMREFVSEVNAIKGQVRARIILHACDCDLIDNGPWLYESWEEFELPAAIKGGGGTSFVPVFDWVETQDVAPDLLVYFTDAKGEFPKQAPVYPVIWLIKGRASTPWGKRVQLN